MKQFVQFIPLLLILVLILGPIIYFKKPGMKRTVMVIIGSIGVLLALNFLTLGFFLLYEGVYWGVGSCVLGIALAFLAQKWLRK